MSEELDRFSRMGRRALGQRNEVGLPQDALNVSSYEQFSVVDPDPNWILIQELCGYGSGSKKVNTGVGLIGGKMWKIVTKILQSQIT